MLLLPFYAPLLRDDCRLTPDVRCVQLIKPFKPCGAHSFLQGNDTTTANMPCTCTAQPDGSFLVNEIGEPVDIQLYQCVQCHKLLI